MFPAIAATLEHQLATTVLGLHAHQLLRDAINPFVKDKESGMEPFRHVSSILGRPSLSWSPTVVSALPSVVASRTSPLSPVTLLFSKLTGLWAFRLNGDVTLQAIHLHPINSRQFHTQFAVSTANCHPHRYCTNLSNQTFSLSFHNTDVLALLLKP